MIFNLPSYNRLARRAARPAVWGFWRWWPSCFAAFAIWYACIRKATSLESPCGSNPRRGILEVLCTDAPQITQTTATRIYHLGFRQGRAQLDKVRNPLSMRFCPHRGGSVKLGGGAGLPLIGSVGANGGQETRRLSEPDAQAGFSSDSLPFPPTDGRTQRLCLCRGGRNLWIGR